VSTNAPTRKEQREQARDERRRREHEAELQAARRRRLVFLGGGLLLVIAAVAFVIAASGGGGGKTNASSGGGVKDAAAVSSEFAGIPQTGNTLGNPNAKATMMVFADMQCPFCAQFENNAMPALVNRYVRPGKLKIVFQPISIIGPDSATGARMVSAAGLQNKEFDYAALWYRNQGTENTGYVTTPFMKRLATATAGLNFAKVLTDAKGAKVASIVSQATAASNTAHVNSTPTFLVAKRGQVLQQIPVTSLTPGAFFSALDAATR
jgi:protein-disulfide isomerase